MCMHAWDNEYLKCQLSEVSLYILSTGISKKIAQNPTRACNRWLVAYTLIRNPSLQSLTASGIRRQFTVELQPDP